MDEATTAALKMFSGVQLIVENANEAQTGETPVRIKLKLNKLRHDCALLNKEFWGHLDGEAEKEFQDKLRRVELILEE